MNHHGMSIGNILFIIGCVLLFLAAFPWQPTYDAYRPRVGWMGLFFWAVSTAVA